MKLITVWGSARISAGKIAEALALSQEHVARSRAEPGCLSHNVSIDAEDDHRLNFFEEWADMAALQQHFKVEGSVQFAAQLTRLADSPPEIRIYASERVN